MRSKEVENAIKVFKKTLKVYEENLDIELDFKEALDEGEIAYLNQQINSFETLLSYIETLEKLPNKIRDKIKEIENEGIWITEDYYYDKELGEEYPIAQSNFSKEETEDIVVDILKKIIGE